MEPLVLVPPPALLHRQSLPNTPYPCTLPLLPRVRCVMQLPAAQSQRSRPTLLPTASQRHVGRRVGRCTSKAGALRTRRVVPATHAPAAATSGCTRRRRVRLSRRRARGTARRCRMPSRASASLTLKPICAGSRLRACLFACLFVSRACLFVCFALVPRSFVCLLVCLIF